MRVTLILLAVLIAASTGGCMGGVAGTLSEAVLNQRDPETVRDGLPAYLILIDGLILDDPDDTTLLRAAARLNSAYAGSFVKDPERARRLSAKGLEYGRRALCEELKQVCRGLDRSLDDYRQGLLEVTDADQAPVLFDFAAAWAGWVQAHGDNWQAIADLPKVQATLERVVALDDDYDHGNAYLYLGVLSTVRPAALGGRPEQGRAHFERAIEISGGRNLMAKVLYARHYARLVFNQALHDRLLGEVLAAEVQAPGLTLANALAREQARVLLQESAEYF